MLRFPSKEAPLDYSIFEADQFDTAAPRNPGDCGVEVMAQIRPNSRVVDHWRLATGGTKILEVKLVLNTIIPAMGELPDWTITLQKWPADIGIRRNMTTSNWFDILELLSTNEITVEAPDNAVVSNAQVVMALNDIPNKAANSAACRWGVVINPAGKLELHLQCLPASVSALSKPLFRR